MTLGKVYISVDEGVPAGNSAGLNVVRAQIEELVRISVVVRRDMEAADSRAGTFSAALSEAKATILKFKSDVAVLESLARTQRREMAEAITLIRDEAGQRAVKDLAAMAVLEGELAILRSDFIVMQVIVLTPWWTKFWNWIRRPL